MDTGHQVWVADDWPQNAYVAATIAVIFVIGIVVLLVMALHKPVRTLMVTYQRPMGLPSADR